MSHRKVLFFGNEPPAHTGAGQIYFDRLFSNFDGDDFAIICNSRNREDIAQRFFKVWRANFPLNFLYSTRFWKWRFRLALVGFHKRVKLGKVRRRLAFEPDLVVTLMQDSIVYLSAYKFARRNKLPLCIFIHDLPESFEPLSPALNRLRKKRDKKILEYCEQVFVISVGMQNYLKEHFGVSSEVLGPMAPDWTFDFDASKLNELKQPNLLTIGYAGGLHYGYGKQIERLIPSLRSANARILLYGVEEESASMTLREAADVISLKGRRASPKDAWSEIQQKCDITLLPYLNPPERFALQYRTHFPSKLAEMTRIGLPILVTGPENAAGVLWVSSGPGKGKVVSDPSQEVISAALIELKSKSGLRKRLARIAYSYRFDFIPDGAAFDEVFIGPYFGNVNNVD